MAKQKNCEPRIVTPFPDKPLRKERELYQLVAEVWLRKQKRLAAEAAAKAVEEQAKEQVVQGA